MSGAADNPVTGGADKPVRVKLQLRSFATDLVLPPGTEVLRTRELEGLVSVGRGRNGDEVLIDRTYVEAELRILTGLVEPHPMAGVSGGPKSICPGLLSVQSVREFHGPQTLAHPKATSLVLEENPCHEVSLEIARIAPPDLILNVTTRQDGRVAGVFAGDMVVQRSLTAVYRPTAIPVKRR